MFCPSQPTANHLVPSFHLVPLSLIPQSVSTHEPEWSCWGINQLACLLLTALQLLPMSLGLKAEVLRMPSLTYHVTCLCAPDIFPLTSSHPALSWYAGTLPQPPTFAGASSAAWNALPWAFPRRYSPTAFLTVWMSALSGRPSRATFWKPLFHPSLSPPTHSQFSLTLP